VVGDNDPSFDPYAHVISKNIIRRDLHLTAEQRRDLIAKVLKARPETSNRQIAKQMKVDDKTVAKVRTKLEARSEIPNVESATDTKGRKQPVRKQRSSLDRAKPGSADERKGQSADEKAAKVSADALAEFTFACRTYLPRITIEADQRRARLLVSELTGVKPKARAA
jgi:outer membrane biosynthesis protein TonB